MLNVVIEGILKYWVTWFCGIVIGLFGVLWKKIAKIKRDNKGMHNGLLALLRDRINESCQYHLSRKAITARDREVLDAMFESYFDMGGNGVVKHLKAEIDELPTSFDDAHQGGGFP